MCVWDACVSKPRSLSMWSKLYHYISSPQSLFSEKPPRVREGQRTICGSWFSPFPRKVPRIELWWPGFLTDQAWQQAPSPAEPYCVSFLKIKLWKRRSQPPHTTWSGWDQTPGKETRGRHRGTAFIFKVLFNILKIELCCVIGGAPANGCISRTEKLNSRVS